MSIKRYSVTHYSKYMDFLENPKEPEFETVQQIDNKQAWVVYDKANGLYCLQSYHTIVSVQIGEDAHDLDKWSRTTTRHQSEFRYLCPFR